MNYKRFDQKPSQTLAIFAAMAISCLCASMPAWAQEPALCEKPLAAQDVSELLESGVPEVRIREEFILPCGVDFRLNAELEKRFRDLGASDRLIAATREKAPISCEAPLSVEQVVDQLQIGVSVERLGRTVAACGVSFLPSQEVEASLRDLGATDELMAAIRERAPAPSPPVPGAVPSEPTPQPAPVARDPILLPRRDAISYGKVKLSVEKAGGKTKFKQAVLIFRDDSFQVGSARSGAQRMVSYASVVEMTYERSKHARVAEAILLSPLFLLSKSKKHWLTVRYTEGGQQRFVLLQLDGRNYKQVIAQIEARTQKVVTRISAK